MFPITLVFKPIFLTNTLKDTIHSQKWWRLSTELGEKGIKIEKYDIKT